MSAVDTVAGMLDSMTELTRIVAINRAGLVLMQKPHPAVEETIKEYDLVLSRAAVWMGAAEVEAIVRETEQNVRLRMAVLAQRPRAAQTA